LYCTRIGSSVSFGQNFGAPKFWPKETLEPILVQYKKDHPAPPAGPMPICKGQ
jgi:hypothetical protein